MASLKRIQNKNGKVVYRITVSMGYDQKGKKLVKVHTYTVKQDATVKQQEREAWKFAGQFEEKLLRGDNLDGEEMSFEDYADKWLASIKDDLAYSTYESYEQIVRNKIKPYFKAYKVARIKTPVVEAFYKSLVGELAYSSITKCAHVLSGMFRTAIRWDMIQVNPCRDAKIPKNNKEEPELKYFTPEQALMFLRSLELTYDTTYKGHDRIDDMGKPYHVNDYVESRTVATQYKVFYNLSVFCGFRKGETLALHWNDIDFATHEISISKSVGKIEHGVELKKPKTKTSVRTVTFPEQILPLLKQYKSEYNQYKFSLGTAWQGDGNLFIQEDGKLMGRSTPYQFFKRHLKRYNKWVQENPIDAKESGFEVLPIIPLHGLRHSCATLLNYLDVNIIDIANILGHAQSSTTMNIYAHSFEEQKKEATNKLELFLRENEEKRKSG
ncbi:MAG: site-specific integrase [Lachnospiraceae bacterium]|nr:site-specific integrase [Lachnospiraceae bacterium]